MKRWTLSFIAIFFFIFSGVFSGEAGKPPIRIAAFYNLTGDMSSIDIPGLQGAQLAVKLINEQGGLLEGRKMEIVKIDTKSDPNRAFSEAKEVVSDTIVAGIGYGDTTYVLRVAPFFQEKGVPFVTSGATLPELPEKIGDRMFMIPFGDDDQAFAIADFTYKRLKSKNVLVWTDKATEFTKTLSAFFKQRFTKLGGKIIGEEFFMEKDKDFSSLVTKIEDMEESPDALFVAALPGEAGLIVKQVREAKIEIPIVSGDGFDTDLVITAPGKNLAYYIFFSTHTFREDNRPEVIDFIKAYKTQYGAEPKSAFAALGYDAVGLIADAIKRGGSAEKDALTRALSETQGYKAVTGEISYTRPTRVPAKPVSIIGVMHGKFKIVDVWKPDK
jgi:branched-chain amino acid transport system substrate-binding protein